MQPCAAVHDLPTAGQHSLRGLQLVLLGETGLVPAVPWLESVLIQRHSYTECTSQRRGPEDSRVKASSIHCNPSQPASNYNSLIVPNATTPGLNLPGQWNDIQLLEADMDAVYRVVDRLRGAPCIWLAVVAVGWRSGTGRGARSTCAPSRWLPEAF